MDPIIVEYWHPENITRLSQQLLFQQSIMAQPTTTAILHPRPLQQTSSSSQPPTVQSNALPSLLHTPAGLALLELQGTINLPTLDDDSAGHSAAPIHIGRIDFPDYRPDSITFDPSSSAWMKRVYMFVGQHQRLTGEVKKLPKALGIVRRRQPGTGGEEKEESGGAKDLEIVEVVKYKIVFSSRPEPVGTV